MELKRDLLANDGKKSTFRIIVGILFLVISVAWIVDRMIVDQLIRPFDWVYAGISAFNGIVHSVEGFGFSLARLFGKAFIAIDNERITIKSGVFAKEQSVAWVDITSIAYKLNRFQIIKSDNSSFTLDVSKLDYSLLQEIKNVIGGLASQKGLSQ